MKRLIAVTAIALFALSANALAGKTIDKQSARGDFAAVAAGGNANHPEKIYMRVVSRPRQSFDAHWSVVCAKGFGAGSKSGSFRGRGSRKKKLRLPMKRPDSCSVGASAQLSRGGKITIKLIAKG